MVMKASEIEHRKATPEEESHLIEMDHDTLEDFLAEAVVVREDTTLFAVVGGVAYHLEELANKR